MSRAGDFRARARAEADRYGPDPWIFVRELLQNARDAGATRVVFRVDETETRTRVTCVDDGEGMSFDHARQYLFSLYASSKEGSRNQVGRFGVGFWSILRFEPTRIVIGSRNGDAPAWAVEFDGNLETARRWEPDLPGGTRVVLERGPGDGHDARRLRDAVWQNARYLHRRDDTVEPLEIVVNGERLNAPFQLPAPSARFARGPVRGVVGLGESPRVELFSRGLRVRAAASLDDLLSASGHTSRSRVRFSELPGAVAPQALLESDALELLLSRSDARDDRTLRRLVKLANDELELLVDRQLAQVRPPTLLERLGRLAQRATAIPVTWRAFFGAVTGATLALLVGRLLWGPMLPTDPESDGWRPRWLDSWSLESVEVARPTGGGYDDLASRYRGPQVSELDTDAPTRPLELTYTPASAEPYFTAMVVQLDASGAPRPVELHPTAFTTPCALDCVDVRLGIDSDGGTVRIPVPTGHALDGDSVRLDGQPVALRGSNGGAPAIVLSGETRGVLTYRTGPSPIARDASVRAPVGLPTDLLRRARALRDQPLEVRVATLEVLVRERVRYSTSAEVAARHRAARRDDVPFIERSLAIGAGDCDVQSGLLVELLQAAGVPARLAVGYVGREGDVSPWLHAWVEWRDVRGYWRIADPSETVGAASLPPSAVITRANMPSNADGAGRAPRPGGPADGTTPPGRAGGDETAAVQGESMGLARRYGGPAALLVGVGLMIFGASRMRTRTARELTLDQGRDLSRMLQGALQKPAAFARLPALFRRRLIPLVGGSAVSLDQARQLANEGRLFRSGSGVELARRASRRRVPVLDAATPEGATVADTLGAVDLDRWARRIAAAHRSPALDAAEATLRAEGFRWRLRAVAELPESVAWLDLGALRLDREYDRLVVVDERDPWLAAADALARTRPARAAFTAVDHIAARMQLDEREHARLLAPLARAMLQEDA